MLQRSKRLQQGVAVLTGLAIARRVGNLFLQRQYAVQRQGRRARRWATDAVGGSGHGKAPGSARQSLCGGRGRAAYPLDYHA